MDCNGANDTDLQDIEPLLGPLQNNGGLTQTMALLPGSPAIDAGDNDDAPLYDQRGPGFDRIVNGIIDIGAFEVQAGPGVSLDSSDQSSQVQAPAGSIGPARLKPSGLFTMRPNVSATLPSVLAVVIASARRAETPMIPLSAVVSGAKQGHIVSHMQEPGWGRVARPISNTGSAHDAFAFDTEKGPKTKAIVDQVFASLDGEDNVFTRQ
jgi:hypothetical protein